MQSIGTFESIISLCESNTETLWMIVAHRGKHLSSLLKYLLSALRSKSYELILVKDVF